MQHDHPLTLQHVLRRMRTMNGDAEVVTLTEGEPERITTPSSPSASTGWPRADARWASSPATASRRSRGTPSATSSCTWRCRAWARCCTRSTSACSPSSCTYIVDHAEDRLVFLDAVAARGRRQCETVERTSSWATAIGELRRTGTSSCSRAPADGFDYPRARRPPAAGLCYTSGTTGNPKGVCTRTGPTSCTRWASAWPTASASRERRPRDAGRADVPRQRLGLPVRVRDGRRVARHAPPLRRARAARSGDRDERVTVAGARADGLAGPAALRRRERARPARLRTVVCGGAAVPRVADARLGGAPRRRDRPGLGDDRDEPARPSVAARARASEDARALRARAARCRWSRTRIVDDDGEESRGTASRPASSRSAAPGSPPPTTDDRRRRRSSTTAGCARRHRLDRARGSIS